MATLIIDPELEQRLQEARRASGADRFDEVWEGVLVMSPIADDEHQELVMGLAFALHAVVGLPGLGAVRTGVNVSDREDDWTANYRIPDLAVFLRATAARNRGTHWVGGPDFAVEILSPGDPARDKLPFYAAIGTRELLLVDRDPWALELYRLQDDALSLIGTSRLDAPEVLTSTVVPLTFQLRPAEGRPRLAVAHQDGTAHWIV